ncbi:MAG: type IV pilus biogenesis protein PilM, partial [Planctomycetota bacterium]
MLAKRKILGLAVAGRSATAVEVIAADGGGRMRRAAEFTFPDGAGLDEPVALGKALRQFLRREGFSASRCVIGMEANCLTARRKTIPPAAEEAVPHVLNLMIEREFGSDREGLVFDYAAGPDGEAQRSVLLVAAPRRLVDQLAAMAEAARLSVAGITPATTALATAAGGATAQDRLVLHLFRGGAELVLCCSGEMRLIRRLSVTVPDEISPTDGWLGELSDELYRVVALLPTEETRAGAAQRELIVWDENCLDREACAELSDGLHLPATLYREPEGLEAMGGESLPPGAQVSAAAALALDALQGRPPGVDLLHSRLAPRKQL